MIEYGVEVNGNWFPWTYNHEGAPMFANAYRHIIKIFKKNAATNVRFAFHTDATENNWNIVKQCYPGDGYIDMIGTSCYGEPRYGGKGCISDLRKIYPSFNSISATKPLGIFEWGIGQATDTANTLAGIPAYPRIKLLSVWNEHVIGDKDEPYDRRINANPANLAAYKKGIASPKYVSTYL